MGVSGYGNLYQSLHRQSEGRDESFVTAGLVHLLHCMKENDGDSFDAIIKNLTYETISPDKRSRDLVKIQTEFHTEFGRPDILISTPESLVFVEVKVDHYLEHDQVERYLAALTKSKAQNTLLVCLTRHELDLTDCKSLSWNQLTTILESTSVKEHNTRFLTHEYIQFLKNRGVAMTQVSSQLGEGIQALNHLKRTIRAALERADLRKSKEASTGSWQGFRFSDEVDGRCIWVGIYFEAPTEIRLETESCSLSDKAIRGGEITNGRNWRKTVNLEEDGFFNMTSHQQLDFVTDFVRIGFEDAMTHIANDRELELENSRKGAEITTNS